MDWTGGVWETELGEVTSGFCGCKTGWLLVPFMEVGNPGGEPKHGFGLGLVHGASGTSLWRWPAGRYGFAAQREVGIENANL